ncbi:MAG: tyrosine-type recombinase/integrase [Mobilitalea sp.]
MQNDINSSFPVLADLIEQATDYVITQKYSKSAIRQHTSIWRRLQAFADSHGCQLFSMELAAEFMKETYGIINIFKPDTRTEIWRVRYIWCLYDFNKSKCFIGHREYNITPVPSNFSEVYILFENYLTDSNQKKKSISTKVSRVKKFLIFLQERGITETKEVSPPLIIEFMNSLECSTAYRSNILITVHDFLNCPAVAAHFQGKLASILDYIHINRYERLPSFYSNKEIQSTLLKIDRKSPEGKKDYAAIILAVELGLRVSDIRKLQLSEIIWDENVIELFQKKTGEFIRSYMTENVKWALLDYLMNARKKDSEFNNVFIRSRAPYKPYGESSGFYERINKYIKLAGIKTEGRHHGFHSCRHGLATRLMNEGTPITVVSEALGHKFANVTKEYIRMDISRLRLAALEVPLHV